LFLILFYSCCWCGWHDDEDDNDDVTISIVVKYGKMYLYNTVVTAARMLVVLDVDVDVDVDALFVVLVVVLTRHI